MYQINLLQTKLNQTELIEKLWQVKKGGSAAWKEAYAQFKEVIETPGKAQIFSLYALRYQDRYSFLLWVFIMIDLLSKDLKHSEKYKGCSIDVWRDDRRGCYLAELYAPVRNRMLMQQRQAFSDIQSAVAYMKEQIDKYYSRGWYRDCIIDVWFELRLGCYKS